MYGYGNSMFLATHGILARTASGGGIDPDAQAFITAASITDPTQQSAINTLVTDLKGYGIWTKFSALYPMVGGTSTSTSYNLKNTAQYQISWNGGVTWGVNGVNGNGINGWGNTGFSFNGTTALSSHISTYIRTNSTTLACEFGSGNSGGTEECFIVRNGSTYLNNQCDAQTGRLNPSVADARGLILNSRTANNSWKTYRNGSSLATGTNVNSYTGGSSYVLNLFRRGGVGTNDLYSAKECAFASIGSGLTDTEAANFYTAVQAFQVTLGRSIGTQTVSDADAQAFVTNAGIVDQVEANAINNLVIGLKADSLWTKMKAVYPFVGGTSTSTTYNLRNTAQYQITWNGGWTWNSNGVTGNGSNSFANTGFNPNSAFSTNDSAHLSLYSRTNSAASAYVDFGATNGAGSSTALNSAYTNSALSLLHNGSTGISTSNTNTQGFYVGTRTTSAIHKLFKGAVQIGSTDTTSAGTRPNLNLYLGAYNVNNIALYHTNRNYAFASIGDGLTDTDVTNLNSRVTTFQTTLNRL